MRRWLLIPVVLTACHVAATEAGPTPTALDKEDPRLLELQDRMLDLDVSLERMLAEMKNPATTDLAKVAKDAAAGAAILRRGYGDLEIRAVPRFAEMARDAETWLLQVELEARQGRADLVRDLLAQSKTQHCKHCHDAVE